MDDQLLELAASIADGQTVDWESATATLSTAEERDLLEALRLIATVTRPKPAEVPEGWGPLRILERVGSGTFGDVYRAWDRRLDREVALKILRRRERDDGRRASAAVSEGRLLARVRHPNVVTVYGAEIIDGQAGVWMEFIHGKTLEQELAERGPFDADRAAAIGVELVGALAAIHEAGLMHRDVKTHNVMRDRDGRLVLTDFGAGCELENIADGAALTGTPVCVAPEVLGGEGATARSDVYSLGVLLYHLVTGAYPVAGKNLKDIRDAHAGGRRTSLAAARPDLPPRFIRAIDRATDPNPQRRYESAAAFGQGLREATRSKHARKWWIGATAAALALISILGVARLWRPAQRPTIAVLPFRNLSAEAGSDYFVDGLTDEIISNLSVIDGLDVRSQTSSFALKGKERNLADVAGQLHANLVVEGSVLRSGDHLRVNAQLVRTSDDVPLWSGRYDRELKDVFAIQDEISRSIVNELRLKLGRGQRRYNTNLDAYELFLRGRAQLDRAGTANAPEARVAADLFQQAIAKDAAFAPAYGQLVAAWAVMSVNYGGVPSDEAFTKMQPAAARALDLDPLLAEAHVAMGLVHARAREWAEAEQSFHTARDLNPNLALVPTTFALSTLFPEGKLAEALEEVHLAEKIDPLAPEVPSIAGYVQMSAGLYNDAIVNSRRALARQPEAAHAAQVMARALFQTGHTGEAIAIFEKQGRPSAGFLGYAYAKTGRRIEAEQLAAASAGLPAREALIYAGLGDRDKTFDALERMAAGHEPRTGAYLTYPELALLRGDPRLAALRVKLGLR